MIRCFNGSLFYYIILQEQKTIKLPGIAGKMSRVILEYNSIWMLEYGCDVERFLGV